MGRAVAALAVALLVLPPGGLCAQDTAATQLPTVVVEVGRGTHGSPLQLPFAVTVQSPDSTRPGQRHLSLDETLWLVPGLTVSNRNNPSQDPEDLDTWVRRALSVRCAWNSGSARRNTAHPARWTDASRLPGPRVRRNRGGHARQRVGPLRKCGRRCCRYSNQRSVASSGIG